MNRNKDSGSRKLFPVLIDLSSRNVMILTDAESAGDALAILKRLIPCADRLTVLTDRSGDILRQMSAKGHFLLKEKAYDREDLYDADVVICTLSSRKIRDDVFAACRTLGIRLCILSEPGRSDFIPDMSVPDEAGHKNRTAVCTDGSESGTPDGADEAGHKSRVTVYTDGSARGNPDGPGGYGAVLEFVDSNGTLHTKELSQGYVKTTNNRMELMAAIAALEALTKPCEVSLWSDSRYLVDAFNEHWIDGWIRKKWMRSKTEPVKNVDLWKRLLAAAAPHSITWNWVKGHDGHPQNERCDALATEAADSGSLIPDPGADK